MWQNYHLRQKFPFLDPPIPPASMFFSAGLQENNFEIGGVGGVGGDNKCLEIFLPFGTNLWQGLSEFSKKTKQKKN